MNSWLLVHESNLLRLRKFIGKGGVGSFNVMVGEVGVAGARLPVSGVVRIPEGGSVQDAVGGSGGGGRGKRGGRNGGTKSGRVAEGKGSGLRPVDSCFLVFFVFYFIYIVFKT